MTKNLHLAITLLLSSTLLTAAIATINTVEAKLPLSSRIIKRHIELPPDRPRFDISVKGAAQDVKITCSIDGKFIK